MSVEVDQNTVDKQCAKIERKNLLITNENLIANCLSNQLMFAVEQSRCLYLEAEISKLQNEKQKDVNDEMIRGFNKLESPPVRRALSSRLRLQHLRKGRVQRKDSDISSGIGLHVPKCLDEVLRGIPSRDHMSGTEFSVKQNSPLRKFGVLLLPSRGAPPWGYNRFGDLTTADALRIDHAKFYLCTRGSLYCTLMHNSTAFSVTILCILALFRGHRSMMIFAGSPVLLLVMIVVSVAVIVVVVVSQSLKFLFHPLDFSCWAVFSGHHSFYVVPGERISIIDYAFIPLKEDEACHSNVLYEHPCISGTTVPLVFVNPDPPALFESALVFLYFQWLWPYAFPLSPTTTSS
ncbi:hypothetical protein Tco_0014986 [Tanacetum coccineum]